MVVTNSLRPRTAASSVSEPLDFHVFEFESLLLTSLLLFLWFFVFFLRLIFFFLRSELRAITGGSSSTASEPMDVPVVESGETVEFQLLLVVWNGVSVRLQTD